MSATTRVSCKRTELLDGRRRAVERPAAREPRRRVVRRLHVRPARAERAAQGPTGWPEEVALSVVVEVSEPAARPEWELGLRRAEALGRAESAAEAAAASAAKLGVETEARAEACRWAERGRAWPKVGVEGGAEAALAAVEGTGAASSEGPCAGAEVGVEAEVVLARRELVAHTKERRDLGSSAEGVRSSEAAAAGAERAAERVWGWGSAPSAGRRRVEPREERRWTGPSSFVSPRAEVVAKAERVSTPVMQGRAVRCRK